MKQQNAYFTNQILEAHDGLHNPKQYLAAMELIDQCSQKYKAPRVYHITLHDNAVGVINAAWTQLCNELKSLGIEHEWVSALEVDGSTGNHPGTHRHYFLMIDGYPRKLPHFLNPYEGGLFRPIQEIYNVQFSIHPPKNEMHDDKEYAHFNKRSPDKINDVKIWISYLYKNRSKPVSGENGRIQIYSRSRLTKKSPPVNAAQYPTRLEEIKHTSFYHRTAKQHFDVSSLDFSSDLEAETSKPELSAFEKMKARYEQQKADRLEAGFWTATTDLDDYEPPVSSNSVEYLNHCTFGLPLDYLTQRNTISGESMLS